MDVAMQHRRDATITLGISLVVPSSPCIVESATSVMIREASLFLYRLHCDYFMQEWLSHAIVIRFVG